MLVLLVNAKSFSHASGSDPAEKKRRRVAWKLFPTQVGVYLLRRDLPLSGYLFSHTRGSVPKDFGGSLLNKAFFPREWEWSRINRLRSHQYRTFSHTCGSDPTDILASGKTVAFSHAIGSDPASYYIDGSAKNFSHASGSDPSFFLTSKNLISFFPREWEWSLRHRAAHRPGTLFPTRVGVIRLLDTR